MNDNLNSLEGVISGSIGGLRNRDNWGLESELLKCAYTRDQIGD